ncbi:MAG: cytochrome c1, partial [Tardiphaga sp.]|nr:cytochrome c1 [Tardiphaga sp.]
FTPYATIKDSFAMVCFMIFFAWFVFYVPKYLGDPDNYIQANPGVTPAHIVPEWYYLPFYAILRSIPSKLGGVIAMFGAIVVLAFLPWLDSARTRSSRYRPLAKQFFWIFVAVCIVLGWLGGKPAEGIYVIAGRVLTACYFAYFLIVLPLLSRIERPKALPNSIADDVLGKGGTSRAMASSLLALVLAGGLIVAGGVHSARAADEHGGATPPSLKWSFAGPFGKFDRAQLQRGYKVYKEVCSTCHSMNLLHYRNLADAGGPGFTPAQALAVASDTTVKDGPNDAGEMFDRPGRLADPFPKPFPNENAGRAANGGAYPPDLSLMAKARNYDRGFPQFIFDFFTQFQEKGPNYIDALLQGYVDPPPADFKLPEGAYYNKYYPGHAIKMPKPISDDQVAYDDGTPTKVENYAKDVATFLMWTAEPHLEARKRMGLQVMIFLVILASLLYFTKKRVWSAVH